MAGAAIVNFLYVSLFLGVQGGVDENYSSVFGHSNPARLDRLRGSDWLKVAS